MKYVIPLLLVILVLSCKDNKQENKYTPVNKAEVDEISIAQTAKQNMENKCYVCHSPTASHNDRVGPPMLAIKARYMKDASTKEDFVKAIWNFTKKPSAEKAKLRGAVKRFGVMPYQKFSQKEIEAIASYMWDYKIEGPTWFKEHWAEKHGDEFQQHKKRLRQRKQKGKQQDENYANIGMQYAKTTKAELGKNLMGAIQKEGIIHALEFCNVQAMPITDSMSKVHQANIKRVSDKNRNPANKANEVELAYIQNFKNKIANGVEPSPIIDEAANTVQFYYPIVTNDMCLKCHGKLGQQLEQKTYNKIVKLYPDDKAIDYGINEVRGIWSISFEK